VAVYILIWHGSLINVVHKFLVFTSNNFFKCSVLCNSEPTKCLQISYDVTAFQENMEQQAAEPSRQSRRGDAQQNDRDNLSSATTSRPVRSRRGDAQQNDRDNLSSATTSRPVRSRRGDAQQNDRDNRGDAQQNDRDNLSSATTSRPVRGHSCRGGGLQNSV